jgi:hypothetical protein
MSAIPLADAPALRAPARVTLAVRMVLAAVAVAATIVFAVLSRDPQTRTIAGLPHDASTIVVLDVSASISTDTYSRIGSTLGVLSRTRTRVGLVVYSDGAYEALPPGTPAATLRPLVRYFTLPAQPQSGFAPTFPPNPWTSTFTGGTRISSGLELAHTIATAQRVRPAVVLVSDLDDDPADIARLSTIVAAFRRDDVPVRVVGLNPSEDDVALFRRLLGPDAPITQAPSTDSARSREVTVFPLVLLVLVAVAAVALALREAWSPRLEWGAA